MTVGLGGCSWPASHHPLGGQFALKPVGVVPAQPGARELLGAAAGGRGGKECGGVFRVGDGICGA